MKETHILSTSRTLPFSAKEIYHAFADPNLLAKWWGPQGFTNDFELFEFNVGGRWKFVMHGPDGQDYPNESIFQALVPHTRVVIEHTCAPHFVLSVTLSPEAAGTLIRWEQAFDNAEIAKQIEAVVGPANEQNLDRLTAVLQQAASAHSV